MDEPLELPELPEPSDDQEKGSPSLKWSPTRSQNGLVLLAGLLGLTHVQIYWLLFLAFSWIGLEFNRHVVFSYSLRQPLRYWVFALLWTPAVFLLAPYGVGRLVALIFSVL
jgi:hypothetical protein